MTDPATLMNDARCVDRCIPDGMKLSALIGLTPAGIPVIPPSSLLKGIKMVYHFNTNFDGMSNIYDAISNYAITYNDIGGNVPTIVAGGQFGNCIFFNGNTQTDPLEDGLVTSQNSLFLLSGDRTFSIWANPLNWIDDAAGGLIMGVRLQADISRSQWAVLFDGTNHKVEFVLIDSTQTGNTTESAVVGGGWNHIGFTWTAATNTMGIFYNGVILGSLTAAPSIYLPPNPVNFTMGCDPAGSLNASMKADELNIWNRVLTNAEITKLYNGGIGNPYPFT